MRTRLLIPLLGAVASCAHAPQPPPPEQPRAPVEVVPPAPAVAWVRTPPPPALAARPFASPATSSFRLPSGLRVVVIEHHRRPSVSLRLVFPAGTAAEGERVQGASALAMALLGDYYEKSGDDLPIAFEKSLRRQVIEAGGQFVSGVTADSAVVGIDGFSVDAERHLASLAAAVMRPRAGERMFQARREALRDELDDLEFNDGTAFELVVRRAAFGATHPYGWSGIGTRATLKAMELADVVGSQELILSPRGATLLVVGAVEARAVYAAAERAFRGWEGEARRSPLPKPAVTRKNPVQLVERKPAFTTSVCAVRRLGDLRGADAELELLAAVLGRMRLHDELRERRGLTYSTSATVLRRRHARALLACSRLGAAGGAEGIAALLQTLKRLGDEGPTQAELDRARASLISELQSSGDSISGIVGRWLTALELDEPAEPGPQVSALRAATVESTRAVARRVLALDAQHVVVWGDPAKAGPAIAASGLGKPSRLGLVSLVGAEELADE